MRDGHGAVNGLVGISIDITERKQLQADLLHGSRLSAMGEMAAALAHELNQPLAAIANYVSGSRQMVERENPNSPLLEPLGRILEQSLRAGQIILRLRSFVSKDDSLRQSVEVSELVEEACSLALIGAKERGVHANISIHPQPMMVLVDRVQIEQVLHNLIRNAIEALSGSDDPRIDIAAAPAGTDVMTISVTDNGPGLTPDIRARLFQPFVSSKGAKGMGVGLSISRTIIESHGGKIWEAEASSGAAFHFTLPLQWNWDPDE
jgi:two-component system sensor kinase FixL